MLLSGRWFGSSPIPAANDVVDNKKNDNQQTNYFCSTLKFIHSVLAVYSHCMFVGTIFCLSFSFFFCFSVSYVFSFCHLFVFILLFLHFSRFSLSRLALLVLFFSQFFFPSKFPLRLPSSNVRRGVERKPLFMRVCICAFKRDSKKNVCICTQACTVISFFNFYIFCFSPFLLPSLQFFSFFFCHLFHSEVGFFFVTSLVEFKA